MEEESKFNFSEETEKKPTPAPKPEEGKEAIKEDAKGLFGSIKTFIKELLDFRRDTDRDSTVEAIKADIPFKGATAWILIFSVFIASIGLNVSSTAVVIGAMLISPLMGPIVGIGLSVAINDIDTLKRSFANLAVMVVLSVLTAFLYFKLSPLTELTPELESRTVPTILDVFVAIFGGLALIVAKSKKGTIASVIFGVAIATALMPPLCTAGYGFAVWNPKYFLGALYLFGINATFIALATFLVAKILRFPMIRYANSARRKRTARIASIFAIFAVAPAIFTFINVLRKTNFESDAKSFIATELKDLKNARYIQMNTSYNFDSENGPVLELPPLGYDQISDDALQMLRGKLQNAEYSSLSDAKLIIDRTDDNSIENEIRYITALRERDSMDIQTKNETILNLQKQVARLRSLEVNQVPFEEINREARAIYKESMKSLAFSNVIRSDFKKIDTVATFTVEWKNPVPNGVSIDKETTKLKGWLKAKLGKRNFVVKTGK